VQYDPPVRVLTGVAAVVILLCHVVAVAGMAGRPLHYDENEYLHASWLMAAGKTIYRDFYEDHPPHLSLFLQTVMPGGDVHATDVRAWTVRARWLSALFGTAALGAVMLFAWRMTRSPAAPVIAAAAFLASQPNWTRAIADLRAEAPTLALFWIGFLLLAWSTEATRAQAMRSGTGIGLVFAATVWNPKWPLEAVIAGALYLWVLWRLRKPRLIAAAVLPAIFLAVLALLPIVLTTTFRDFVFFNVRLKAVVAGELAQSAWIQELFRDASMWDRSAPQHRWWLVVPAIGIAALLIRRRTPANPRLAWLALALAAASLLEIRFLYPYPYLWPQYLVMMAAAASLVYALVAAADARVAAGAMVVLLLFVLVTIGPMAALVARPAPRPWNEYWATQRGMQQSLRPTDRVWISPPRHPVAAFDASYYWYNFRDSVPAAIRLRERFPELLPAVSFTELPPCRLDTVRYLELGDWMTALDRACPCAERAFASGKLAPTPAIGIFEVTAERRRAAWLEQTRHLWANLCRSR
jgi:hypothetical protein